MSPTRNTTLMRRSAPIEMRELTDRHRAKRLIAIGEIRTPAAHFVKRGRASAVL